MDVVDKKFQCTDCGKSYKRKSDLHRHYRTKKEKITCSICNHQFNRKDNFNTHVRRFHGAIQDRQYGGKASTLLKESSKPLSKPPENSDSSEENSNHPNENEISQAINGSVTSIKIKPKNHEKFDFLVFFSNIQEKIQNLIVSHSPKKKGLKWYLVTRVEFSRERDGEVERAIPHFRSITYRHLSSDEFNMHFLNEAFQKMFASKEEFIMKGSDWIFSKVIYLEICYAIYSPLKGGNYIKEPMELQRSRSLVNIKNNDQKCFLYSVLAKLYPAKHNPSRLCHYLQHTNKLNMNGIQYPVHLSQIPKFENQNDISINVFGYEDKEIFPMRITKSKRKSHVDLLYLKKNSVLFHYCLIKNLNRFLYRTEGGRGGHAHYYCPYCLHGFLEKKNLNKHIDFCMSLGEQKIEMPIPGENDILKFTEIAKQLRVPFIIYADFETYVKPIYTCDLDPNSSHTCNLSTFEPCGYAYHIVSTDKRYSKSPVVYRGDNIVETFLSNLLEEEDRILHILRRIEPMHMTIDDENLFEATTHCHLCGLKFQNRFDKVRNHDHVTGEFFGAAHNDCNLLFRQVEFIPVVLHNLRGFDAHLIMQRIGRFKNRRLNVIANTNERYISFSISKLRFVDSFQFLSTSLDNLVKNLKSSGEHYFVEFNNHCKSQQERDLLLQKGIYPYSFCTDASKFLTKELPPKQEFYNTITKTHISEEEYKHAEKLWKEMNIQTMGEYHDLYVLCDVLLLADVFERFRCVSMKSFDLDPAQYYTLAGMCWSACLKMTGVELELLTDFEQYQMIERGIRGGVAMMTMRHAEANNCYIPESYDPSKPNVYLGYFDMNNLYGGAMVEPLPVGNFCWLSEKEILELEILNVDKNDKTGYILEVTLEYPAHLHICHNDLPLAPEKLSIKVEDLSPYCLKLFKRLHKQKIGGEISQKLVPTLRNKDKYVVHYRNLQFYLQHGLVLKKIHRAISFDQRAWLKPYIEFNTRMRQQAQNDFEVSLYKAYNNIVFGYVTCKKSSCSLYLRSFYILLNIYFYFIPNFRKTMENIRTRLNFNLVHTKKQLQKLVSKPSFETFSIFNKHLVGVKNKKVKLLLNKPIYTGMTILDLSKLFMYEFHYDFVKREFGENAKLLMTDTDSLFYR